MALWLHFYVIVVTDILVVYNMVAKLKRTIRSFFTKKPKHKLDWNVADFEAAKAWCKTQPHPHNSKQTLWDYVYGTGRIESAEVLAIVNILLKEQDTNSDQDPKYVGHFYKDMD